MACFTGLQEMSMFFLDSVFEFVQLLTDKASPDKCHTHFKGKKHEGALKSALCHVFVWFVWKRDFASEIVWLKAAEACRSDGDCG